MNVKAYRAQLQWASGLNALAGIWLFVSAFVLPPQGPMVSNNMILGAVVAVLAVIRLAGAYNQVWMSWVNAIIGVWLVIAPSAMLGTGPLGPSTELIVNNTITGWVIGMLALWSAAASTTQPVPPATYSGNIRPSFSP